MNNDIGTAYNSDTNSNSNVNSPGSAQAPGNLNPAPMPTVNSNTNASSTNQAEVQGNRCSLNPRAPFSFPLLAILLFLLPFAYFSVRRSR